VAGAGNRHPPVQALYVNDRAVADRRLFERFADPADPVDRDVVIERFLPLARQLAARYQRPGESFDDVFQAASYGLIKAVERYDPARGVAFSSFAVPTIVGEIKRHFRDRTWAVRVPRDLQELSLRVDSTIADLIRRLGRQPSVAEIANALDREPDAVLEAMQARAAHRVGSLDAPRAGAGADDEAGQTVGEAFGMVDDGFARAEQRATIDALLRRLSTRERVVLRLRFEEDLTQAEIGLRVGVSQMQVSRILRQAISRLREVDRAGIDGR
jgi:RNA polymerase sigma-B factor